MNAKRISIGRGSQAGRRATLALGVMSALLVVAVTDAAATGTASSTPPPSSAPSSSSSPATGDATVEPTDAVPGPEALSSRGFDITNLSGYQLKLQKVTGDERFEGRPDLYSTMRPGDRQTWEVQYVYMSEQNNNVFYDVYDFTGNKVDTLEVRMTLNGYWSATTSSWGKLTNNKVKVSIGNDGKDIRVTDPKAGTYVIGGDRAQEQAGALNNLCAAKVKDIDCTFQVTSPKPVAVMKTETLGPKYANRMPTEYKQTLSTTTTESVTQSIEVGASAKVNVYNVVEAAINSKFSQSWTRSKTYTETHQVFVQPGTKVWQTGEFPMLRHTGDFTVKAGDTTWVLRGVSFDSPDPTRAAELGWDWAPLTADDKGLANIQDRPANVVLP